MSIPRALIVCIISQHLTAGRDGPNWKGAEMTDMTSFEILPDDKLLSINAYCEKYHRSRPSYYRDKAAGRFHVVMIGSSPRIVDRSVRERAPAA